MGTIVRQSENAYRVVLIKTIEGNVPIYYRLVKLSDYSIEDVPAYRIMDEIISKGKHIENIRCENNKLYIIDSDNYDSTAEVVTLDEFDNNRPNAYDWAMGRGERGKKLIKKYSVDNKKALSDLEIDTHAKLAWTCDNGHTVYSDFATYFGTNCRCALCEVKSDSNTMSLRYWCNITNNLDILKAYENAGADNIKDSEHIAWNSKKQVKFILDNGEQVEYILGEITSKREGLKSKEEERVSKTAE